MILLAHLGLLPQPTQQVQAALGRSYPEDPQVQLDQRVLRIQKDLVFRCYLSTLVFLVAPLVQKDPVNQVVPVVLRDPAVQLVLLARGFQTQLLR